MDAARWSRAKDLFQAALEREPGQRDAFLRDACQDDESLREPVAAMLTRYPDAVELLRAPAFQVEVLILLHSGYSKAKAFLLNMLSSCATLVGGVLGYYALQVVEGWTPVLLGIVAASMIYVAVADLIPGLHRRPALRATIAQTALIALGIGAIALVRALLGDLH